MSRVLLSAGALLVTLALAIGAPLFGGSVLLSGGPFLVGVLLVIAGAVLALKEGTRLGRAARIVIEGLAILAVVVAVQAAALHVPIAFDLSSNRTNTLADKSVQIAHELAHKNVEVMVEAHMGREDRAFVELETLLDRYRVEGLRVVTHRTDAKAALGDPNAIVIVNDRRAPLRIVAGAPEQEEQVTNALVQVTQGAQQRVYFVSGHGEPELVDDGPDGISRWRDGLATEGVLAVPLPLARLGAIPEDAAALVVAGPSSALAANEAASVRAYLERGGRVLVLAEPGVGTLDDVVGAYGVGFAAGPIVDESAMANLAGGADTATGSQLEHAHPITRPLGDALLHFTHARPVVANPGPAAVVTPLVLTGTEAKSDGAQGPLALAMAAVDGKTRVVVVGDASFAKNRGLQMGANRDFAINAVLWLVERDDKIAIRPKGRGGALLLLTPTGRERLAFALLYGMPLSLVVAGFGVRAWRRRT